MPRTARIPVQPDVLVWARESAGLDRDSAARRVNVSPEMIERWETGDRIPTLVQLRQAASAYNRPLSALFVATPLPDPAPPVTDFRSLDPDEDAGWSPALRVVIQRAVSQRQTLLEFKEIAPEAVPPTDFAVSIEPGASAETAGATLRAAMRCALSMCLTVAPRNRSPRCNPGHL